MKLRFLNYSAVRKAVRKHDRRLSTSFLVALDEHCASLIEKTAAASKDERTLTSRQLESVLS